ncbi:unnamed protein product [Brassica oleracea]
MEKSNKLSETESKLNGAMEEVASLSRELEMNQKLLEETQMNCVHLENCLHEAREEAQTHLCAADRRACEYNTLRASSVKMRGLFEKFRSSVCAGGWVASFAESLRTLAQALAKEKISFGRLQVHEIAAFLLNPAGHYEAINRNCPNYYLSSESEALHRAVKSDYLGSKTLASSSMSTSSSGKTTNSYGLSSGCEYFIVTIAMLPHTAIHQQTS